MGSLRTPVGPLPSAIYWRRRAVMACVLAVVLLLVFWAVRSTGGGSSNASGQDDGKGPADSITPGPTPSESLIEERPGGREDDGDGDEGDEEGDDGGSADSDGSGGSEGQDDGGNSDSAGGDGSESGGDSGGGGGGAGGLPGCLESELTLSLRSDANDYSPGEEPELRFTAENTGAASCRVDFGHDALTISLVDDAGDEIWSSADCPETPASSPTAVSAGGTADHTIIWDLRHSSADCDADPGPAASPGTYLAEAQLSGHPVTQTSFRLAED
ncbi:hypothetical protein [Streptomyces zhaozhouensis]|nr:hypothetical protein [Streptomyces zhaozhouensis]